MMNKYKVILSALLLGLCLSTNAATAIQLLINQSPYSINPFFDKKAYVFNDSQQQRLGVLNVFEQVSYIDKLDDNHVSIQVTDNVTWELFVQADSTMIFIQTACAPVCSSVIKKYTTDWTFVEDVFCPTDHFVSATFADDGQIIYTDHTDLLIDDEERKMRNSD